MEGWTISWLWVSVTVILVYRFIMVGKGRNKRKPDLLPGFKQAPTRYQTRLRPSLPRDDVLMLLMLSLCVERIMFFSFCSPRTKRLLNPAFKKKATIYVFSLTFLFLSCLSFLYSFAVSLFGTMAGFIVANGKIPNIMVVASNMADGGTSSTTVNGRTIGPSGIAAVAVLAAHKRNSSSSSKMFPLANKSCR